MDFAGPPPLPPYRIEGPFEKCKDFEMGDQGVAKEHYLLLIAVHGRIAAAHKRGAMGAPEMLRQQLNFPRIEPPEPREVTGQPPKVQATQLRGEK